MCRYFCVHVLFPLNKYPVVEFLDHMVVACLNFDGKLVFQSGCTVSHFHQHCMRVTVSLYPFLSILIILVHAEWYLMVVLICISLVINEGLPRWHSSKKICLSIQETQETQIWSLCGEESLEKEMATHSSILAGKSHGQRSLVGYTPWGYKESDIT